MKAINEMKVTFLSRSANEGFARAAVAAFAAQLDPAVDELADLRTAVSEAVTNAIVHGYRHSPDTGSIAITVSILAGRAIKIEVKDKGCGIPDITEAMQPLYTTDKENERSGMGFTIMENFMDSLKVTSAAGKGTKVIMSKHFSPLPRIK